MLRRKVVKSEQPFFVLFQALGGFGIFGLVTGDKLIVGCQSAFACR